MSDHSSKLSVLVSRGIARRWGSILAIERPFLPEEIITQSILSIGSIGMYVTSSLQTTTTIHSTQGCLIIPVKSFPVVEFLLTACKDKSHADLVSNYKSQCSYAYRPHPTPATRFQGMQSLHRQYDTVNYCSGIVQCLVHSQSRQ